MSATANNFTHQHLTLVTKNILAKVKKCLISGTVYVSGNLTSLVEHSDAQPSQIREQILVPDLYVLTVESLAFKKIKHEKKTSPKKFFLVLCNFSVRAIQCKNKF